MVKPYTVIIMKIINVDIMQDTSEIVHYDEMGIPLYVRIGELSFIRGKRLCVTGMRIWSSYVF